MHICCICGKPIPNKFNSNNPYPVRPESSDINDTTGRCCPKCNDRYVMTCRLRIGSPSDIDYEQNVAALQKYSAKDLDEFFKNHNITPNDEIMFDMIRLELKRRLDRSVGEKLLPNFPRMALLQKGYTSKLIKIISKYYAEYLNGINHSDETWNDFITNKEIIRKILSDDGNLIYAMPQSIKADKELALIALKADQGIYTFLDPSLQFDMDVAIAALLSENVFNPVFENDFPEEIWYDPKFQEIFDKARTDRMNKA